MPTWHRLILLYDDSDGIGTEGRGIVTIVILKSRQMKCASFTAALHFAADAILELK